MVTSVWEIFAVLAGLAYLLLAVRENPWCWVSGGISTLIFGVLFWRADLYMQSLLQVYYVCVSAYGWWHWRQGQNQDTGRKTAIVKLTSRQHMIAVSFILSAGLLNGLLLDRQTTAALPYLDALTMWGGVLATLMVARKVLENWLYWVAIDAASMALYAASGLYLTTGLFFVYLVIAIAGFFRWKRSYQNQSA